MSESKTIEVRGASPVLQTNRLYVSLSAIGHLNDKGKSILKLGYGGRIVGEPDKPLATVAVVVLQEIADLCRYSSAEAVDADIRALREFVDGMFCKDGSKEPTP